MTKEEEVREAFLSIKNSEGLLNGIINCARITGARQSIKETSPQEFKRVVDGHLFGTIMFVIMGYPVLNKINRQLL